MASPPSIPVPSQLGPYRIHKALGSGSMASAYLADQEGPGGFRKRVALKVVKPELSEDDTFIRLLMREAAIGGLLRHPNIIQTLSFEQYGGAYVLVLEYVEGETLAEMLARPGQPRQPLAASVAFDVAIQVCRGLSYAHRMVDDAGQPLVIVHRDLKPQNVIRSAHGLVKIMDFGIARATASWAAVTAQGVIRGTPSYMSPEQVLGRDLDGRSDLFSLGSIIWEMICGEVLFKGPSMLKVMERVVRVEVGDAWARAEALAPGVSKVLKRLVALQVNDRYPDSIEAAEDIKALLLQGNAGGRTQSRMASVEELSDATGANRRSDLRAALAAMKPDRDATPTVQPLALESKGPARPGSGAAAPAPQRAAETKAKPEAKAKVPDPPARNAQPAARGKAPPKEELEEFIYKEEEEDEEFFVFEDIDDHSARAAREAPRPAAAAPPRLAPKVVAEPEETPPPVRQVAATAMADANRGLQPTTEDTGDVEELELEQPSVAGAPAWTDSLAADFFAPAPGSGKEEDELWDASMSRTSPELTAATSAAMPTRSEAEDDLWTGPAAAMEITDDLLPSLRPPTNGQMAVVLPTPTPSLAPDGDEGEAWAVAEDAWRKADDDRRRADEDRRAADEGRRKLEEGTRLREAERRAGRAEAEVAATEAEEIVGELRQRIAELQETVLRWGKPEIEDALVRVRLIVAEATEAALAAGRAGEAAADEEDPVRVRGHAALAEEALEGLRFSRTAFEEAILPVLALAEACQEKAAQRELELVAIRDLRDQLLASGRRARAEADRARAAAEQGAGAGSSSAAEEAEREAVAVALLAEEADLVDASDGLDAEGAADSVIDLRARAEAAATRTTRVAEHTREAIRLGVEEERARREREESLAAETRVRLDAVRKRTRSAAAAANETSDRASDAVLAGRAEAQGPEEGSVGKEIKLLVSRARLAAEQAAAVRWAAEAAESETDGDAAERLAELAEAGAKAVDQAAREADVALINFRSALAEAHRRRSARSEADSLAVKARTLAEEAHNRSQKAVDHAAAIVKKLQATGEARDALDAAKEAKKDAWSRATEAGDLAALALRQGPEEGIRGAARAVTAAESALRAAADCEREAARAEDAAHGEADARAEGERRAEDAIRRRVHAAAAALAQVQSPLRALLSDAEADSASIDDEGVHRSLADVRTLVAAVERVLRDGQPPSEPPGTAAEAETRAAEFEDCVVRAQDALAAAQSAAASLRHAAKAAVASATARQAAIERADGALRSAHDRSGDAQAALRSGEACTAGCDPGTGGDLLDALQSAAAAALDVRMRTEKATSMARRSRAPQDAAKAATVAEALAQECDRHATLAEDALARLADLQARHAAARVAAESNRRAAIGRAEGAWARILAATEVARARLAEAVATVSTTEGDDVARLRASAEGIGLAVASVRRDSEAVLGRAKSPTAVGPADAEAAAKALSEAVQVAEAHRKAAQDTLSAAVDLAKRHSVERAAVQGAVQRCRSAAARGEAAVALVRASLGRTQAAATDAPDSEAPGIEVAASELLRDATQRLVEVLRWRDAASAVLSDQAVRWANDAEAAADDLERQGRDAGQLAAKAARAVEKELTDRALAANAAVTAGREAEAIARRIAAAAEGAARAMDGWSSPDGNAAAVRGAELAVAASGLAKRAADHAQRATAQKRAILARGEATGAQALLAELAPLQAEADAGLRIARRAAEAEAIEAAARRAAADAAARSAARARESVAPVQGAIDRARAVGEGLQDGAVAQSLVQASVAQDEANRALSEAETSARAAASAEGASVAGTLAEGAAASAERADEAARRAVAEASRAASRAESLIRQRRARTDADDAEGRAQRAADQATDSAVAAEEIARNAVGMAGARDAAERATHAAGEAARESSRTRRAAKAVRDATDPELAARRAEEAVSAAGAAEQAAREAAEATRATQAAAEGRAYESLLPRRSEAPPPAPPTPVAPTPPPAPPASVGAPGLRRAPPMTQASAPIAARQLPSPSSETPSSVCLPTALADGAALLDPTVAVGPVSPTPGAITTCPPAPVVAPPPSLRRRSAAGLSQTARAVAASTLHTRVSQPLPVSPSAGRDLAPPGPPPEVTDDDLYDVAESIEENSGDLDSLIASRHSLAATPPPPPTPRPAARPGGPGREDRRWDSDWDPWSMSDRPSPTGAPSNDPAGPATPPASPARLVPAPPLRPASRPTPRKEEEESGWNPDWNFDEIEAAAPKGGVRPASSRSAPAAPRTPATPAASRPSPSPSPSPASPNRPKTPQKRGGDDDDEIWVLDDE